MDHPRVAAIALGALLASGCSIKKYAINQVGDVLASGGSVFESDSDLELVGDALPFSLEAPGEPDRRVTEASGAPPRRVARVHRLQLRVRPLRRRSACGRRSGRGSKAPRTRPRPLSTRPRLRSPRTGPALSTTWRNAHPGSREGGQPHRAKPQEGRPSAALLDRRLPRSRHIRGRRTTPRFWLAFRKSKRSSSRALELDESWDEGTLHEFAITLAGAKGGELDLGSLREHYDRALALSNGKRASLFLVYAETISVPAQQAREFRELLNRALAVDLDAHPELRFANGLARRRARWLLDRIDELFLEPGPSYSPSGPSGEPE